MRKELEKYGHELCKTAAMLYPHYRPKQLHQLRITIKKLRALLRWRGIEKKICKKHFREIYHIAGEIRNHQVLLKNLHENKPSLLKFANWLEAGLGTSKNCWHAVYREKIIADLEEKLHHTKILRNKTWFRLKTKELQSILKHPTDEALHEARKIYKDFQYIDQWCRNNKVILPDRLPANLVKTAKMLGQYHDHCIAVEYLNQYLPQEKNKRAKIAATRLKEKWLTEKKNKKKLLLSFISDPLK